MGSVRIFDHIPVIRQRRHAVDRPSSDRAAERHVRPVRLEAEFAVGPGEAVHVVGAVELGLAVGSVYGMQVAPAAFRRITGIRSLRDIPASKDIFAAAGWAVLVAGLPAMSGWPSMPFVELACVFSFVPVVWSGWGW